MRKQDPSSSRPPCIVTLPPASFLHLLLRPPRTCLLPGRGPPALPALSAHDEQALTLLLASERRFLIL